MTNDKKMRKPEVNVCILQAEIIRFNLDGQFNAKGMTVYGPQEAEIKEGGILWNGNVYQELIFKPLNKDAVINIHDVVIGINFHWQRKEYQTFKGALKFIVNDGKLAAINILKVEDYLVSVISSEMNANAPEEFLKAHAVISRSWLLAQIEKRRELGNKKQDNAFFAFKKADDMLVRWYDREDHTLFDVCADDHCQRYQGITRASTPEVERAVQQTAGMVLNFNGKICDARFSKCCGGMMERFSACWEDDDKAYLIAKPDYIDSEVKDIELTDEVNARRWIETAPKAFCNTDNKRLINVILNNYDQETDDFYRWKIRYSQHQIAQLINSKTKADFGDIIDIIPIKRGRSARIILLKIVGTKKTFTFGKELEIRRILSDSHLKSSAFVVDKVFTETGNEIPSEFILTGAGWGHGVGLCQIGAAVMADQGFDYQQILTHYYPNANIQQLY